MMELPPAGLGVWLAHGRASEDDGLAGGSVPRFSWPISGLQFLILGAHVMALSPICPVTCGSFLDLPAITHTG